MTVIDLIASANHNLLRNKTRTILTILAIFIGSFSIITTTAIQNGVNDFIDSQVGAFGGEGFIQMYGKADEDDSLTIANPMTGGPQKYKEADSNELGLVAITREQFEKVKTVEGIKADTVLDGKFGTVTYVESTKNSERYTATLNLMTKGSIHFDLVAGQMVDNDSAEYQVLLPTDEWTTSLGYKDNDEAIGKILKFVVLDPITKQPKAFEAKIVGVQAPSVISGGAMIVNSTLNSALYDENTKYLPEVEKEKVYTIAAEFDYEHYKAEDIKKALDEIGLTAMTVEDIVGQIKSFFDVIITTFTVFGYVALLAASIGIINTLFMAVQERTREIGLMKSFGMGGNQIFFSFALEAVMLGFWGSVLGTIASMAALGGIDAQAHMNDGFLQMFPTFHLGVYTIESILPVILTVMIIAFVAGVVPARRASRKNPIDALRYE
ncbi:ABC transporter permease [Candidatus Saccharibacteria bacterium]|nr:ABC transporter permease [Candidatus Saccharibacteria bacterium]